MLTMLIVASLTLPDRPPQPDSYLYPAPSFTLDGGTLTVHNASIAYLDSGRGVDLERGIVLMDSEHIVIPYHPGADIVWSLEPGTYDLGVGSIDIGDERYWHRGGHWAIVVPAPSRLERLSGLIVRLIEIRAEIRSLSPTDDEVWEALEEVDLP